MNKYDEALKAMKLANSGKFDLLDAYNKYRDAYQNGVEPRITLIEKLEKVMAKYANGILITDSKDVFNVIDALTESLTKAKLFDEMVEARKRATRGEWSYTDHNWHESSIYASGTYLCTFDFDRAFAVTEDNQSEHEEKQGNNLKFVTLCANLTEKHVKES